MARIQFQLSQLSGPRRNQKIAWVVTDGNHNTGVSPITAADELRQLGKCLVTYYRSVVMGATMGPFYKPEKNLVFFPG